MHTIENICPYHTFSERTMSSLPEAPLLYHRGNGFGAPTQHLERCTEVSISSLKRQHFFEKLRTLKLMWAFLLFRTSNSVRHC